jgi:hypothetical protein
MKVIWEFPFENMGMLGIDMPVGAEILTVQVQDGVPCIWAMVDPGQEKENRIIVVHGTGHPVQQAEEKKYIGTYQEWNGSLIWHVFELAEG